MSASVPSGSAVLGVGALSETHSRMHGRTLALGENVLAYGADRSGTSDSTAAFVEAELAAGAGGRVFVPRGTFIVDNWTPVTDELTIVGTGFDSILRAKTAGSFAMTMNGLRYYNVQDLTFDGAAGGVTATASGLKVQGSSSAASLQHVFTHVRFRNAIKGLHVAAGVINQADKNTYFGCQWVDSTTGFHVDSPNAQQQCLYNPFFASLTTAVHLTHGGVTIFGGQAATTTTFLLMDGTNISEVAIHSFIDEGSTVTIDGTSAWVQGEGAGAANGVLTLTNSTVQGITANVIMGQTGSKLYAFGNIFSQGNVSAIGDDTMFADEFNGYNGGAVYAPTVGANQLRYRRSGSGIINTISTAGVSTQIYKLAGAAGDTTLSSATGSIGFFGHAPATKPTALTAADAGVVDNTYGAEEAGVIGNLRTRLGELESKLQALGLIT